MSTGLEIVLAAALVTYLTRVVGFAISGRDGEPPSVAGRTVDRFLIWAPIAAFSASIVPDLADGPGTFSARIVGAALACLAISRVGKLSIGLAAGFGAFWAVQLFSVTDF